MCYRYKFLMMKYIQLLSLAILFIFLSSCEKEAEIIPKEYPYVVINSIKMKTNKYLTINAQIFYSGNEDIIDHGFILNNIDYEFSFVLYIDKSMGALEKGQNQFSLTMEKGLIKNMTFSVRAFTETSDKKIYSNVKFFISPIGYN